MRTSQQSVLRLNIRFVERLLIAVSINVLYCFIIILMPNAALICLTTTAFSTRKPRILYEEPTDRELRVLANAEGHDLARC